MGSKGPGPEGKVTPVILPSKRVSEIENVPVSEMVLPKKENTTWLSEISTPTLTPEPEPHALGSPRQKPNSGPAPTVVVPSAAGLTVTAPVLAAVPVTVVPKSDAIEGEAKARGMATIANASDDRFFIIFPPLQSVARTVVGVANAASTH
jgi:hypothetical protein